MRFLITILLFAQLALAAWSGKVTIPRQVVLNDSIFYEISSPEELMGFLSVLYSANDVHANAYLKNDIVFGKDTSSLSEKRWLRDTQTSTYYGLFDGRGHTIYGFNSDKSLFDFVAPNAGVIKNLNVANSRIGSEKWRMIAGVVENNYGFIENLEVRNSTIIADGPAAGIVGYNMMNSDSRGFLKNLRSISNKIYGKYKVGGVVGVSYNPSHNLYNSSDVFSIDTTACNQGEYYYWDDVGGVAGDIDVDAGYNSDSLINEGRVTAISSCNPVRVGGIAGSIYGTIRNSRNFGRVYGRTDYAYVDAGGIAGYAYSYWDSDISSDMNSFSDVRNYDSVYASAPDSFYVGGIIGYSWHNVIRKSVNVGYVEGISTNEYSIGYAGGVVGMARVNRLAASMSECGNYGDVRGSANYDNYVGGVAGYYYDDVRPLERPSIERSFNRGDICAVVSLDTTTVAEVDAGGIVGMANQFVASDVYNFGNVKIEAPSGVRNGFAGGIAGKQYYYTSALQNAYSAAEKIDGPVRGGFVGSFRYSGNTFNDYVDSRVDIPVFGDTIVPFEKSGESFDIAELLSAEMQTDDFLLLLNTNKGTAGDRHIWVRGNGYPVFAFDTSETNVSSNVTIGWNGGYEKPEQTKIDGVPYYVIKNRENLAEFIRMVKTNPKVNAVLANDIMFGTDKETLSKEIWEIDYTFEFEGILDGQNHVIYGMNAKTPLFGYIAEGAQIRNLTIANSLFKTESNAPIGAFAAVSSAYMENLEVRDSEVRGASYAAGIFGYPNVKSYMRGSGFPILRNCRNVNTKVSSDGVAGGIAANTNGYLISCSNSGEITAKNHAGGIVAWVDTVGSDIYGAVIDSSRNSGNVTVSDSNSLIYAGGIAGHVSSGTISNNFNSGKVTINVNRLARAGGILGDGLDVTLLRNGNTGEVSASAKSDICAGGILGYVYEYRAPVSVVKNFNYGSISAASSESDDGPFVGGIGGCVDDAFVSEAYNYGSLKTTSYYSYWGFAGGLVGKLNDYGYSAVSDSLEGYVSYGYNLSRNIESGNPAALIALMRTKTSARKLFYEECAGVAAIDTIYQADTSHIKTFNSNRSDSTFLAIFNTQSGKVKDKGDWVLNKGIPVLAFDTVAAKFNLDEVCYDDAINEENDFDEIPEGKIDTTAADTSAVDSAKVDTTDVPDGKDTTKTVDEKDSTEVAKDDDKVGDDDKDSKDAADDDKDSKDIDKKDSKDDADDGEEGRSDGEDSSDALARQKIANALRVSVNGFVLTVRGALDDIYVFDVQGNLVAKKATSGIPTSSEIRLQVPCSGTYLVRSSGITRAVTVR
ncbi:hypothetical protein [Fibrobacter sp.]|uniref:hypothetical protein n=1 Tax=Fibrobacter sp. TaxID=35828 RepID=UPI00388F561E